MAMRWNVRVCPSCSRIIGVNKNGTMAGHHHKRPEAKWVGRPWCNCGEPWAYLETLPCGPTEREETR